MPNTALSDAQTLVAVAAPKGYSSSTTRVGWIDMGANRRLQFIVNIGAIGAAESVTAAVQQATDTNGTSVKALSPVKAITAITASNSQAVVNLNSTELDVNNGFRCAGLLLTFVTTATTGATLASVSVQGDPSATPPASLAGQVVA